MTRIVTSTYRYKRPTSTEHQRCSETAAAVFQDFKRQIAEKIRR